MNFAWPNSNSILISISIQSDTLAKFSGYDYIVLNYSKRF